MAAEIGYLSLLQRVGDISWLLSLTFNILRMIKRFSSLPRSKNIKNQNSGFKMAAKNEYLSMTLSLSISMWSMVRRFLLLLWHKNFK